MTRSIILAPGEFYHIYNRGTDKRKVFLNPADYKRFIALLYLCNSTDPVRMDMRRKFLNQIFKTKRSETLVDIGSYCLMPNHFHLLIREKNENGISLFMQKLTTAYTMYFNKKYERNGSLFQGTFKVRHIDTDNYLKYLFAYIHLNPLKLIEPAWKERGNINVTKAKKYLSAYEHSSYLSYIDKNREENVLLSKSDFPEYFSNKKEFEDFHFDFISFSDLDT